MSFVFALVNPILSFFSAVPTLSLISSVGLLPNTKKLFFWLSLWDDQVLSTPKIETFLPKSLPKPYESVPSNAIPWPL